MMKNKREAKFGLLFRHWLKGQRFRGAAFELKQTQTNSIPFNAVAEHQLDFLLAVKSSCGIIYKIPDDSRGIKPFDMFMLQDSSAYIVIRYPGVFVLIDAQKFKSEQEKSIRKSLTKERAIKISTIYQELK